MSGKIGVIWVGHQCDDYIERSLRPWVEARREKLGGHEYVVCAVSVPFIGFDIGEHDSTRTVLYDHLQAGRIDHLIAHDTPMKETEARGAALKWLVEQRCDTTIMVDADEFYLADEIARIFAFVESRPYVATFKGSLKNYVEASGQRGYLTEPFTPMRVHRVRSGSYVAHSFWDDNNVLYRGTITRDFKRDIDLTVGQIPRGVAFVHHESWPNSLRGKKKQEYQWRRWGNCSFCWDDSKGGLIFNPALPEPEVIKED